MAKCIHCGSCYRVVWVNGIMYWCCTLCRKVYSVASGGLLTTITDPAILKAVYSILGPAI